MLSLQMTEPEVSDLLLWCCCTTWVVDAVEDPEIGTVDAGFFVAAVGGGVIDEGPGGP